MAEQDEFYKLCDEVQGMTDRLAEASTVEQSEIELAVGGEEGDSTFSPDMERHPGIPLAASTPVRPPGQDSTLPDYADDDVVMEDVEEKNEDPAAEVTGAGDEKKKKTKKYEERQTEDGVLLVSVEEDLRDGDEDDVFGPEDELEEVSVVQAVNTSNVSNLSFGMAVPFQAPNPSNATNYNLPPLPRWRCLPRRTRGSTTTTTTRTTRRPTRRRAPRGTRRTRAGRRSSAATLRTGRAPGSRSTAGTPTATPS